MEHFHERGTAGGCRRGSRPGHWGYLYTAKVRGRDYALRFLGNTWSTTGRRKHQQKKTETQFVMKACSKKQQRKVNLSSPESKCLKFSCTPVPLLSLPPFELSFPPICSVLKEPQEYANLCKLFVPPHPSHFYLSTQKPFSPQSQPSCPHPHSLPSPGPKCTTSVGLCRPDQMLILCSGSLAATQRRHRSAASSEF